MPYRIHIKSLHIVEHIIGKDTLAIQKRQWKVGKKESKHCSSIHPNILMTIEVDVDYSIYRNTCNEKITFVCVNAYVFSSKFSCKIQAIHLNQSPIMG